MVHFFLYDYKFEDIWIHPDKYIQRMKRYRGMLTPDFSMYIEMHPIQQFYNTFKNRWVGAYFAAKGVNVIPTVNWGLENTFSFCFNGIEKGSAVAVSTYMVSEHNNHADQKEFFLKGYNEMLRRIEPEKIICYNEPFPEMDGNIVFVDYALSSWRHRRDDLSYSPSPYAKFICGIEPWPKDCEVVRKIGYVVPDILFKGSGSAEGGKWKPSPNKPDDQRLVGKPGETKRTVKYNKNYSYTRLTKIGEDGRAIKERHWTDHNQPWAHTNPHDHNISWDNPQGFPDPGSAINYPEEDAPEFKYFEVKKLMREAKPVPDYSFHTISEFKWCMQYHGEVEFIWNNKTYNITHRQTDKIGISEAYRQETEKLFKDADDVLEYLIDGVRLRDIITKVEVTDRTV